MITPAEQSFLLKAYQAATASRHVWPEYAACEAARESSWGESRLASDYYNLFGQKVWSAGPNVIAMQTKEVLKGAWVAVNAYWKVFPSFIASFEARMTILKSDARYAAALAANDGPLYVEQVSKVWSTDPMRAAKVMSIWTSHHLLLEA